MTTDTPTLHLDQIRIDGGTQPRVAINEQVVDEYAELLAGGVTLPPVTVFFDGATYWLADGFHRYWANKRIQCDHVFADIRQGTQRDAQWHAFGANADHGLRRTRDDIAHILKKVFSDDRWSKTPVREIAKHTGIPKSTVQDHRQRILSGSGQYDSGERTFTHPKTGKPATMHTANIGRSTRRGHRRRKTNKPTRNAFRPAPHSEESVAPMRSVQLPLNNPQQAARSLISVYGEEYMRALAAELNRIFQPEKGAQV